MTDRIPLGETRREAISRVQERLGPATSRPLAEQTFWALAKKGKITLGEDGSYLIEAEIDDDSMRDTAKQTIQTTQQAQKSRSRGVQHFSVTRNHFYKARVGWQWKATQASIFAPSLAGAEGYQPDGSPPAPSSPAIDDDQDGKTD